MSLYEHDIKLIKARANLIMAHPFFGTLAIRMKLIKDETKAVTHDGQPTMATDGVAIYYHPDFLKDKTANQLLAVFAHEVLHTAFLHHTRMGHRDPLGWNFAGDFAINQILKDSNFDLPQPHLLNPAYKGMGAEQIYSLLPKDDRGSGGNQWNEMLNGMGNSGIVLPAPKQGGQTQDQANKQAESEMKVALSQAAFAAKQAGKLPGDLERLIEDILEPILPWKNILRRFMTETARGDVTWNYPNRRSSELGVFIPSISEDDPHMKDIVIAVDTSGSIGPDELNEFGAEINAIHQDVQPRRTIVIYCDADVNGEPVIFAPEDEVILEPRGGGGTDFRPPFALVDAERYDPQCFVYLTDGYGSFPDEKDVKYPVMWAMTSDVDAPFGEILRLRPGQI